MALARGFFGLVQPIRAGSAGKRTAPCSPLTFNTNEVSSSSFPASLPRWRRGYQAVQPAGAEAVQPRWFGGCPDQHRWRIGCSLAPLAPRLSKPRLARRFTLNPSGAGASALPRACLFAPGCAGKRNAGINHLEYQNCYFNLRRLAECIFVAMLSTFAGTAGAKGRTRGKPTPAPLRLRVGQPRCPRGSELPESFRTFGKLW
ncbi:MAG: hypothetical protein IPL27_01980 [Lewinellaceae bacterium]|nr:hypothetical protein [Lewinellaceae bacterium]